MNSLAQRPIVLGDAEVHRVVLEHAKGTQATVSCERTCRTCFDCMNIMLMDITSFSRDCGDVQATSSESSKERRDLELHWWCGREYPACVNVSTSILAAGSCGYSLAE